MKNNKSTDSKNNEIWCAKHATIKLVSVKSNNGGIDLNRLGKEEIRNLLESLVKMIQEGKLIDSDNSSRVMKNYFMILKQPGWFPKLLKDQLKQIYDSFVSDDNNFLSVARVDIRYQQFWEKMLESYELDSYQVEDILGRPIKIEFYYGWGKNYVPEALFFPLEVTDFSRYYSYNSRSTNSTYYTVSLPCKERVKLLELFGKKDLLLPLLSKELPSGENLIVEDFEGRISTDLITLSGIALSGSILSANGSISAASIKRIKKQYQFAEFLPVSRPWPLDRVELVVFTYFLELSKERKRDITVTNFAKFAVDKLPGLISGTQFNIFFPAFQGFTKSWSNESFAKEIASDVKALLLPAFDEWMSLENFRLRILSLYAEKDRGRDVYKLFTGRDRSRNVLRRKIDKEHEDDSKWTVLSIDWFEEIGFKFAVHWLKFLCAIGIVDLAVTEDRDDDPLEGIRYVKVTALGRYAFGIDKDYTPKQSEELSGLEYDDTNRIITISNEQSPYLMFLSQVGKQISTTRFYISTESLMKGCKKRSDLETRVQNLKTIIDVKKEPNLKAVIDEAFKRTDCATESSGYSLLKLRPDLPGLLKVIMTDPELRKISLLTEHSRILVKTSDLEKFNTLCAANGYLME